MADAAIGATIQVVLETVLSFANDRIGQVLGLNEELRRLSKTVKRIRGLLADADDKKHSSVVQDWLEDLEEWVFKAENALDELNYENLRREVEDRSQRKRKLSYAFPSVSTITFRFRMASKIKDINANLERINREANEVGLVFRLQQEAALSVTTRPQTAVTTRPQTDFVVVPNVVGRGNDESKIVEMLLNASDKIVSVIPIVGMGGLGKTTLAKSVYNDPKISGHFGKKIWVCVAEKIKIEELFKFILESLTGKKVDVDRRSTIVHKIGQELEGKRYFLVLDDVWDDRQGLWNDLFTTLEGLSTTKGSWCLATTRLEPVANTMSRHLKMNVDPYKLGKLTDDECWSILKGKVIAGEEVPQELADLKQQILRRCGGLPLSASLIGGLLLNKGKKELQFIMEDSLLNGDQDDVKQIIKVSFDHLSPASVKKCFVYCSIFSQDTAMKKDLLVELWMAEGFLQPKRLMEDIGDTYFGILLQSSLLEEVKEWRGTRYKMHDLVHDFAKSALNEDRYLALNSSQSTTEDIIKKSTTLRTLFLESSISGDLLSKFECLHVLKLSGEDVKELPACVGELIHLRVLDISDSGITILPESLCKLYNLQTMRIKDGKLEEGLPKQMSNLISLRHLHYYDTRADFQMPSEMGRLTRLQTLKFFTVGQEDGGGIEELGSLKDLKGSLEIRNLELVNGKDGAEGAKLFEKPNLSELKYSWGSGDRDSSNCDENVLEGLQPHPNLQELRMTNFMGDRFPGWFINLSTLVGLNLRCFKRCTELPALGQLPSLETLIVYSLENISSIGLSIYGISSGGGGQVRTFFPALKFLALVNMVNLVEWKAEDEVKSTSGAAEVDLFPVLEKLLVENCSRLTNAPSHFPSIKKLDIRYNCHLSLLKKIVNSITSLSSLELTGNMLDEDDSHSDERTERLFLVKRRHSNNLEEDVEWDLHLDGCGSLPSETLEHLCHLPNFRHLKLRKFSNLARFIGQESFSDSLQKLEIFDCNGCIPGKMLKSCDSFQELKISGCHGLTSLPGEILEPCASLKKLEIFGCSVLTSIPGKMLKSCASLQELKISGCDGLTSLPSEMLELCASLKKLEIFGCSGLTIIPGEMLKSCASLRILKVYYCSDMVSFSHDLQKTSSLEILVLSYCPELMIADMPKGFAFLTNLRELEIGPFSINEEFDWSGLPSTLTCLRFYGLPHVESLPEQLQYLTSLTELCLEDFGIEALPDWIGKLASLERIVLSNCEKLRYLPSMDARRRLTKFTSLRIWLCPLLEERCNSGTNSEWPIILHVIA